MLSVSSNYFYDSVVKVNESVESLHYLTNLIQSPNASIEERVEALEKVFALLDTTLTKNLNELTWSVKTLDREKDSKVVHAAFHALNELQIVLNTIAGTPTEGELEYALVVREKIHSFCKNFLGDAIFYTHHKIADLSREELPTLREMENGEQIYSSGADLMLSKREVTSESAAYYPNLWNMVYSPYNSYAYVRDSLVFTPGKYYNPIPMTVGSYNQGSVVDSTVRVADIISMIRGERMSITSGPFSNSSGTMPDKYGEFVEVPHQFAADLVRSDLFKINGVTFYDCQSQSDPNETGREIYRLLGNIGGVRLMQICHQGITPQFLLDIVFPLIAPEGVWSKMLPGKFLVPSNASGFMTDLSVDHEKNIALVSMKMLMKLHTSVETEFEAHFVIKIDIKIPLDELNRLDFIENKNPAPNLHVTDTISTLVINNPVEARELLSKF